MTFISMFLSSLLLLGCNSEKKVVKYYQKYRTEIESIKDISQSFSNAYGFEYCSIRKLNVGIRLLVHDKHPDKGTGEYYDPKTLEPTPFSMADTTICDSCTEEERERYRALLADSRLKELLRLYMRIKPDAIRITSDGVFFALGAPLKHPNKSEVEGGIFIPFGEEFFKGQVVKQIEGENAYLYDTVVQ